MIRATAWTPRIRLAGVTALLLLATSACTGPGSRPHGSTPELELQKLHDLTVSPVPPALVGGLDKDVEQLDYEADNAAGVTLSLTRMHVTDLPGAFTAAVHVAQQHEASFSVVQCFGRVIGAQGTIRIASGSSAAPVGGWTTSLLLTASDGSLQAKFDILGGIALPPPAPVSAIDFSSACSEQVRRAFDKP